MAVANIEARITAKDNTAAPIRGFLGNIGQIATGVALGQAAFHGLQAAINGAVGVMKSSLKAFQESEDVTARLRQGLENVGDTSKETEKKLLDQAAALQKTTRFSDEQIVSAQSMFTTFLLNGEQIEQLTPRVLDMAEALRKSSGGTIDLEQGAILLGKALGGEETAGLAGALRRVGVVMTETQTKMLETGNMEERLTILTQIMDQNFKGFAEAGGKTSAGAMAQLSNSINDLQEIMGGAIAEAINPFIQKLTVMAQQPQTVAQIQQIAQAIVVLVEAMFKLLTVGAQIVGWLLDFGDKLAGLNIRFHGFIDSLNKKLPKFSIGGPDTVTFKPMQQGGMISETGPHFMHAGEHVQPAGTVARPGGGGVVVNFYGDVNNTSGTNLDEIGRRITRQIELSRQGAL